ncbi:uncharacterized protein LOC144356508 [Saccoglossus kowalevskii]
MNSSVSESFLYDNAVAWTAFVAFGIIHNVICLHVVAEYTIKWKSSDMLIFSLVLTEFFNLAMPMSMLAIITVAETKWSTSSCQFLLWSLLTFRVVVSLHQAFLALDRVWFLKWPSAYRIHFAAHRSSKTVVFIWLLSTLAGFMPILGWEDTSNADVHLTGKCHILLSDMGLGYSMSLEILLMLTIGIGTACVFLACVDINITPPKNARRRRSSNRIPSIVIESDTGEKTPAFDGNFDIRGNQQTCKLVCILVLLDNLVDGVPYVAVNTYSLAHDRSSPWMGLVIVWCNVARAIINPCLIQHICERYKDGFKKTFGGMGNRCCVAGDIHQSPTKLGDQSGDGRDSPLPISFPNQNYLSEDYGEDYYLTSEFTKQDREVNRTTSSDIVLELRDGVNEEKVYKNETFTLNDEFTKTDSVTQNGEGIQALSTEISTPRRLYEKKKQKAELLRKDAKRSDKLQVKDNFRMESVEEENESEVGSDTMYTSADIDSALEKEYVTEDVANNGYAVVEAHIESQPSSRRNSENAEETLTTGGDALHSNIDNCSVKDKHDDTEQKERALCSTPSTEVTEKCLMLENTESSVNSEHVKMSECVKLSSISGDAQENTECITNDDNSKQAGENLSTIDGAKCIELETECKVLRCSNTERLVEHVHEVDKPTRQKVPLKYIKSQPNVESDQTSVTTTPSSGSPSKSLDLSAHKNVPFMLDTSELKLNLKEIPPEVVIAKNYPCSPLPATPPDSARSLKCFTPKKLMTALESAEYSVLDNGEIVRHENENNKKTISATSGKHRKRTVSVTNENDEVLFI